jgi:hypothetical protein
MIALLIELLVELGILVMLLVAIAVETVSVFPEILSLENVPEKLESWK